MVATFALLRGVDVTYLNEPRFVAEGYTRSFNLKGLIRSLSSRHDAKSAKNQARKARPLPLVSTWRTWRTWRLRAEATSLVRVEQRQRQQRPF